MPNQLVFIENFFNRDPTVLKATNELSYIFSHLPKDILSNIIIDLTLARGADYYTGFILEGIVNNINVGAILGGGRYDNLVSKVGNLDEPAVGLAFGLERLLKVIKTLESINFETCFRPKILLAKKDNKQNICSIADKLRKEFDVDIYYDSFDKNKVLNYAEYNHYPLIVCISSSEIEFHAINGDSSMEDKVKTLCTTLDG
ncbi:ATP phosphoribosyltransferase regulatory subunit [Terrilactibacillus sp. S3-3]|nr:ATP phosphoribosyltransferase regulatory subunit [Terrilactibacillus sp. S3-3]